MGLVQMRTPFVGTNIAVPFSDIYLFLWGTKHLAFWHLAIQRFAVTSSQLNLDFTIKLVSASLSTAVNCTLSVLLSFRLNLSHTQPCHRHNKAIYLKKWAPSFKPGNIHLHSKVRRTTCITSSRLYQAAYLQLHYFEHYNSSVVKTADY